MQYAYRDIGRHSSGGFLRKPNTQNIQRKTSDETSDKTKLSLPSNLLSKLKISVSKFSTSKKSSGGFLPEVWTEVFFL